MVRVPQHLTPKTRHPSLAWTVRPARVDNRASAEHARAEETPMRATLLHDEAEKTFAIVFDKHDEFMVGLTDFVNREGITAAHFTAIGAFSHATLGYFERDRKAYKKIPIDEQVEVLSLI